MNALSRAAVLFASVAAVAAITGCGGATSEIVHSADSVATRTTSADPSAAAPPSADLDRSARVALARRLVDPAAGALRDVERALRLVDGVCSEAFASSCDRAVAIALLAGRDHLAEQWATDACATSESACVSAAAALDDGCGGRRNPGAARHLYKLACERGSQPACIKLGLRTRTRGRTRRAEVASATLDPTND